MQLIFPSPLKLRRRRWCCPGATVVWNGPENFWLRRFLSHRARQTPGMKLKFFRFWRRGAAGKTVVTFGAARLVRRPTGQVELIGGSLHERQCAQEWASLFLHEAIVV